MLSRWFSWKGSLLAILLLLLVMSMTACGAGGEETSNDNGSQVSQNNESKQESFNLDLKTAAEVVDYVKDMDPAQREAVLLEGAKREGGSITFYGDMREEDLQKIGNEFKKKYPGINLSIWRAGDEDVIVRIINEFRSGVNEVDVMSMDLKYTYELNQDGIATPHLPPNIADYPESLYDPDGIWIGARLHFRSVAWNTDLMQENETPNTWQDLADAKYKGRFSLGTDDEIMLLYLKERFGEQEGTELAQKIAANDPIIIQGLSAQVGLLQAGDFAMSIFMSHHIPLREVVNSGAPLDFKFLEGPVVYHGSGYMLAKEAPHPYGAVLLKDWLSSPAGQQMVADTGFVTALPGMNYKSDRTDKVLTENELYRADPGSMREQISAEFREIFGLIN